MVVKPIVPLSIVNLYVRNTKKLNAVLRWCLDKIQHKQMNPEEWKKYNKAIAQYLAGIVDLEWGDNSFKIIELKRNEPRRRTKR